MQGDLRRTPSRLQGAAGRVGGGGDGGRGGMRVGIGWGLHIRNEAFYKVALSISVSLADLHSLRIFDRGGGGGLGRNYSKGGGVGAKSAGIFI